MCVCVRERERESVCVCVPWEERGMEQVGVKKRGHGSVFIFACIFPDFESKELVLGSRVQKHLGNI